MTTGVSADRIRTEVTADIHAAEWDQYVSSQPDASVYHFWRWRSLFESIFNHETIYLAARRPVLGRGCDAARPRIVGVLPLVSFRSLLFGRFLVSLPFVNYGGVLASDEEASRALIDAARVEASRRGATSVELRHARRMFPDLPVRQHKVAMTLALPADTETLWKTFDNKVRNQVRKAEKNGFETVVGGAELVRDFYAVFARNMRDLGTPVYPRRLFEWVLEVIPESRMYVVRLQGAAMAAGITIGHRSSVENPWASSLREYRPLNPNMWLYWTMLKDAVARGYQTFDFGRSSPNQGTYYFKKQWGARESPFWWEYVLSGQAVVPGHGPDSPKYRAAVSIWQRLPLVVANTMGPLVVRNIP